MNVPRAPADPAQHNLPRPQIVVETPSAPSPSGRTKPVATACDRCRRRKIRCDGETPCATCRRFGVSCIRPRRSDTQALEHRVRQLEAQIADLTANFPGGHGQDPTLTTTPATPRPWTPEPGVITTLSSPRSSISLGTPLGQFASDNSPSPIDIPRIEVYAPFPPGSLSPSPSLQPSAPITSNSMTGLRPSTAGLTISPPMTACPSPNYDPAPYLTPTSMAELSRSRSSSISSLDLGYDLASSRSTLPIPALGDPNLGMSLFEPLASPIDFEERPARPTPYEAKHLLDKFSERARGFGYPITHGRLMEFLDIINADWEHSHSSSPSTFPPSMARFHVYMAMAIGLRMEGDDGPTAMQLLHDCYRLAIAEVRQPSFWQQPLAAEGAILLMLFAQTSRGDTTPGYG